MSDRVSAPVGSRLDDLGVEASLAPDDLVSGAVVILTVVDGTGGERVQTCYSTSTPWAQRVGMTVIAADAERRGAHTSGDD